MNAGDIVLISIREFGDDRGDVIHKYYPEEAFELQDMGELPETMAINEGLVDQDEEDQMAMGDYDDEEENKNDDLDIDDI